MKDGDRLIAELKIERHLADKAIRFELFREAMREQKKGKWSVNNEENL